MQLHRERDMCSLLDANKKSTAKLLFTFSDLERSKSGSFRFRWLAVCKGTELAMCYH